MKICPTCQKTYNDDNLNFCLEDGSVLTQVQPPSQSGVLPETVLLNQPRMTQPPQPMYPQTQATQGQQQGWNTGPQAYSMQPKKSSKTWIWIVLILGVVVVACGGGGLGLLIWIGSQADKATNTSSNNTKSNIAIDTNKSSNSSTGNTPGRDTLVTVDLEKWAQESSAYANLDFSNGELTMSTKQKRYYYVHPGNTEQKSGNADVSVIVRNPDNSDSSFGYGLVFHSNPTALQQGYAFLIDSKKKRYRVVHHYPQHEDDVVAWTKSDAILDGTQANKLEARDRSSTIDLYINGKMVTSIKNTYGYAGGVVGLYVADGLKASFKNFEIRK